MIQDEFNFESEDENELMPKNGAEQPKEVKEYEFMKKQANLEEYEKH